MKNKQLVRYGAAVVAAVLLCGLSFGLGVKYQKGQTKNTFVNGMNGQSFGQGFNGPQGGYGGGRFRNGQRPNVGQVTAVSSDSVSIHNSRLNADQTFKITSDTIVQNNGATASVSDIKTGETVLIVASRTDTSTATQITLNPSVPGASSSGNTAPDAQTY